MNQKASQILDEIEKVIIGKRHVVERVLMAILSEGHVLLDDVPGTGKTTLALSTSRVLGMDYHRIQFTPDVVPSDITGFSIYNKASDSFEFKPGVVMTNLLLADEINRTSSKTQSALLEVMEEGQVTVDGVSHPLPKPFVVIATQNPVGSAGTQLLPQAQLDRFMIRISMGYPDFASQVNILRDRQRSNPLETIATIVQREEILDMQQEVRMVHAEDSILAYITALAEETRKNPMIRLGVSPRGALALLRMAKARAYVKGRDFLIPEDIQRVFCDVCAHRIILNPKARVAEKTAEDILREILKHVSSPDNGREK
ncbi:MAG: MoxR family ATPase [Eubacteriales bacterium]|nr:MoxR family ATPase [Eubacteriales bacterium]